MSLSIIPLQYEGQPVAFSDDGWLHATKIAERFGKKPAHWLELDSTKEYIRKLSARMAESNVGKSDISLVVTRRGNSKASGTWLHPKLAVKFARWLSVDFEIWCDEQISDLLYSAHPARERLRQAHARLEYCQAKASEGGRALARWRWDRPQMEREVEHWCSQLQLLPGRGGRQEPDHGA